MSVKPPVVTQKYTHKLSGVYGQFGSGAGVQAFYLQSVLAPAQLQWISLISEIKGSERWPVRDLFQREVDNDRISMQNGLLDYLKDQEKVKFFNPITLTPLPMEPNGDSVVSQMPKVVERSETKDGNEWHVLERPEFHQVRWVKGNPQYAELEWYDTRVKLVAIDGQHRLSALKRFWRDQDSDAKHGFLNWNIPVVVVTFRASAGRQEPPSVLEVVRNIFVYINSEARPVGRSREILLSDESVNAVCTQELVQLSHTNDQLSKGERKVERLPLMAYDWRGEEEEKKRSHSPTSLKGIEEIFNWFRYYILGEDFSDEQETALGIIPTNRLHEVFHDNRLTHARSKELRTFVREDVIEAFAFVLENFIPYRSFVTGLRSMEDDFDSPSNSDIARHAFYELRFGTNHAPEPIKGDVAEVVDQIKARIERLKREALCDLISQENGMRGIACAYGELRLSFGRPPWREFATWFVPALNTVYRDGWLDTSTGSKRKEFLHHVAIDHNDAVVNYRLEHASEALGPYLQLLVASAGKANLIDQWASDWMGMKEVLLDRLKTRITRGFKKELRPKLKEEFPDEGRPLAKAVEHEAGIQANRQIRRFEQALKSLEGANPSNIQ